MKKGQATIFIVIGIVLFLIILITIFLRAGIIKKATVSQLVTSLSFEKQVEEVKNYVRSCLESTTNTAIDMLNTASIESYEEYERQIALIVKAKFPQCTDFSKFKGVKVENEKLNNVTVKFSEDKKSLYVEADYNLDVIKGKKSAKISNIATEINFKVSCCIPVEVDNDCIYNGGTITVTNECGATYTIHNGDSLKVGDICVAC